VPEPFLGVFSGSNFKRLYLLNQKELDAVQMPKLIFIKFPDFLWRNS